MKNFRRLLSSAGVWTFVECCDAFEANKSAGSCGEIKEALRILYVHGYGSKINRTGRAIEKLAKQEFGDIRMLYNHYYDEIASVQQIKEIVARIDSDCRKFNPHIVIGSSFGGFLVLHIPGYMRILINPCLLPSEHVGTISPDMPETDLENLKTLEHSCLSN
ncbi:MAG: alpha/beta hydrolase, partial [Tannerella sp.]|nr:alpha/beta hydrolase [Tannerella sp.]